jgi:methyl halide transferase
MNYKIHDGKVSFFSNLIISLIFHRSSFLCIEMWSNGIQPGQLFDKESPSPLLIQYIRTPGMIPEGRALVPGCGRGYDVAMLAFSNRVAIGLDISEVAVAKANEYIASLPDSEFPYKRHSIILERSFFALDPSQNPEEDVFDFVYDYTFLCALDPSVRPDWAQQMAAIIKPGGLLMTMVYPIIEKEGGPPFAVTLDLYTELLSKWFVCEELRMVEKELCHIGRDGGEDGLGPRTGVGRWRRI